MAYFKGTVRSNELAMDTCLHVILPWDRPCENQEKPCKTLYLLHGLGDDSSAWTRYTCVERYARDAGIAVVMPEVQRSFYRDMKYGLKYYSYITKELPQLCGQLFGLDADRGNNYIAGLSMGGYGAMKCGLLNPDRYAGCASFSGVLDFQYLLEEHLHDKNRHELIGLLGEELRPDSDDELDIIAEKTGRLDKNMRPRLFITCGKQDFLYQTNVTFRACLDKNGIDYTYHEWDGEHEWGFWDKSVRMAIQFFFYSK